MPVYAQVSDMPTKATIDDEDYLHVKNAEDGIDYRMLGRIALQASEVSFDPSVTDLDSVTVQDAIDEIAIGGTSGGQDYYKTTSAVIVPVGPGQLYSNLTLALRKYATRVSTDNLRQRKAGATPLVILSLQPDFVWTENIVVSNVDLSHIRINQCMWGDIKVSPTLTGSPLTVTNGAAGPSIGGVLDFQSGINSQGILVTKNSRMSFGGQIGVVSQELLGTGYVLQNQEDRKYFFEIRNTKNAALDVTFGGLVYCGGMSITSGAVDKGLKVVNSLYGVRIKSLGVLDMCGFRVRIEDSDFGISCSEGVVYCNKYTFISRSVSAFAQPGLSLSRGSKFYCGDIRITNTVGAIGAIVSGMSCIYTLEGILNGFNEAGYPNTSVGAGTIVANSIGLIVELNSFVDMYLSSISGTSANALQVSKQSEANFRSPTPGGTISIPSNNSQGSIVVTSNSCIVFGDCVVDARNSGGNTGFNVQGFSTIHCQNLAYGTTNIVPMTLTVNGLLAFSSAI